MNISPELITVSIRGVPLIFVVIGVVTIMRKAGLDGKALLFSSLAWGATVGGAYQVASLGVPVDFGGWFGTLVYGLGVGLLASLFYDTLKGVVERALGRLLDNLERKPPAAG